MQPPVDMSRTTATMTKKELGNEMQMMNGMLGFQCRMSASGDVRNSESQYPQIWSCIIIIIDTLMQT